MRGTRKTRPNLVPVAEKTRPEEKRTIQPFRKKNEACRTVFQEVRGGMSTRYSGGEPAVGSGPMTPW